jgi:hypothetical protein
MKKRTKIYLLVLLITFILLYISNNFVVENANIISIIQSLYQITGGLIFVLIMYDVGYKLFRFKKELLLSSIIVIIPGFIIAINNFPISAYINDRFFMTEPNSLVYLYFLESFTTAFFEEIIFRGMILFVVLQRVPNTKQGIFKAIVISSAIFGLSHLLNLFGVAGLANTLLQVGYSFLMGMMWAIVFIKTENILYSIVLHATYNYFGYVLFKVGTVINRYDLFTLIITTVFALLAVMYYYYQFTTLDTEKVYLFCNPEESEK